VVLNGDIGENQDSVSKEIDLPEVLRFAQDDTPLGVSYQTAVRRFPLFLMISLITSVVASDPDREPYLRKSS
jgi:hypothetical protein